MNFRITLGQSPTAQFQRALGAGHWAAVRHQGAVCPLAAALPPPRPSPSLASGAPGVGEVGLREAVRLQRQQLAGHRLAEQQRDVAQRRAGCRAGRRTAGACRRGCVSES